MIGKEKTEIFLSTESYLKWELVFVGPFGQPKADCENQIFWSYMIFLWSRSGLSFA